MIELNKYRNDMPLLGSLPLTVIPFIIAILDGKLTPKNFSKIILETHT